MIAHSSLAGELLCQPRAQRRVLMREQGDALPERIHEAALAADGIVELRGRDGRLVCLEGRLWVTRLGDPEDHVLEAGQALSLGRRDQVAVQALGPSRFRLLFR